jgi:Kef-type K+ transport system membrane component KefB
MFARWFPDLFPIGDPVLVFAIVLVLFLGAPIVMGRVRLPAMIGLLIAGAILGPHALGILARDASFVLLGAVGLIYIMFTAALEIDLSVFRKYGVQGVAFGVLTFSIPQGLGTLMAYYVLGFDWLPAILLASMFASHTLLAYPIVSRLGLSTNQAVTTAVGGTMITDTAALLVLAVVAGMATGEVTEAFWWRLGVSLIVFVSAILLGLPRLGRWFFRRVAEDGSAEFVFVLTSVFLCAALSHAAGLEPIVGAFLAGIALNRLIPHNGALMNRLTFTGEALFIPFFLLSVGMLLDPTVLFGGIDTWVVAICMTVTVIATKWLAAMTAQFVFRFRRAEGQVMFGLSVVQAAATLAAVMVGHRIGLFDDTVVNGTIVMILVTCILGPWVVARFAPRLTAEQIVGASAGRGTLVPLLCGDQAEAAMELALLLRRGHQDPIYPAFVAADGDALDQRMADADKILARAVTQASAADCLAQPVKRVHDNPGRALVRARKELGSSNVVVPWDAGSSKTGARVGRIIDELATDRGANLFVCRLPQPLGICTRILAFFPPDTLTSEGFSGFVRLVERLAKQLGAPVLLLCHEPEQQEVALAFQRSEDPVRHRSATYPGFRLWLPVLTEHVRDTDLLVLYGAREGDRAASGEARGLAQRIASRFVDYNLVVIYAATGASSVTDPKITIPPTVAAANDVAPDVAS